MIDDSAQLDYEPIWITDSNNYLQSFADWNTGGLGDKVHLRTAFVPFEQAEEGSATQKYIDIVTDNGGDLSQLGQQATSAFLLWATAAKACSTSLRRSRAGTPAGCTPRPTRARTCRPSARCC